MLVNSVNSQNFCSLNTKKCEMFANELKNNRILKNASKQYNIKAFDTKTINSKRDYVYDIVLSVQEKSKNLFDKLFKKAVKGTVTIECYGDIRPGKIAKTIDELKLSDIQKSAKGENIVKSVEKSTAEKVIRDANLDFRFKDRFGDFPQDSLEKGVKKYYHAKDFDVENLSIEDLKKAVSAETELKYMAEFGMI